MNYLLTLNIEKGELINISELPQIKVISQSTGGEISMLDKFDDLMEKELPQYKNINYDKISPSLIIKFSK